MGIFSRLTDIVNANVNVLLEQAEDPEKMVKLMIKEMEDTLVEVRSEAVRVIAEKKELERRLAAVTDGQKDWEGKAEFALSQGREDLARAALAAKRKLADEAEMLIAETTAIDEAIAKYDADMGRLNAKLDEAKAKRKSVEIRMKTAEKRVKMRRTLDEARINDALDRYARTEAKIDELEADAEAYDLGKAKTLQQEFADLAVEKGVEDDLSALKRKLAGTKKEGV